MFSKKQQGIIAVLVVLGLLGICFIALALLAPVSPTTVQPTPTFAPTIAPTATQAYLMELVAMNGAKTTSKHFEVRGQVRNISSQRLDNVQAVVSLYDSNGTFIKSEAWLIEFNPILPGQVSPFNVIFVDDPKRASYSASFKVYGGSKILVKDSR